MASSCRSWCTCASRISNCPEASLAVCFMRLMNLARTICLSGARCSTCPPISWVCCANSHRLQIFSEPISADFAEQAYCLTPPSIKKQTSKLSCIPHNSFPTTTNNDHTHRPRRPAGQAGQTESRRSNSPWVSYCTAPDGITYREPIGSVRHPCAPRWRRVFVRHFGC
jgi:hypothetical protein